MPLSAGDFITRVIENDVDAVRRGLAESPSLVAARDRSIGSTPLHFAAHRGFADVVAALLDAGADVHALEEASDTTPLHWAAEGGHPAIAEWLLARGASLEALDSWYRLSPLGWSSVVTWAPSLHEDRPAAAQLLLAAGAEIDPFSAVALGRADDLRRLVAADPGVLARRLGFVAAEMQPLHLAVQDKRGEMVRLLLDLGADPSARTSFGMTALALALAAGDADMAALLRERGADDDASTALVAGDMAALAARLDAQPDRVLAQALLFAAASREGVGAIGLLVGRGADPNGRMRQLIDEIPAQVAPLHLAARAGRAGVVRALIAGGARPDPGAEEELPTPLHVAAVEGHLDCVRALLAAGADVLAKDRARRATPGQWAAFSGHTEIADLLAEAGRSRTP